MFNKHLHCVEADLILYGVIVSDEFFSETVDMTVLEVEMGLDNGAALALMSAMSPGALPIENMEIDDADGGKGGGKPPRPNNKSKANGEAGSSARAAKKPKAAQEDDGSPTMESCMKDLKKRMSDVNGLILDLGACAYGAQEITEALNTICQRYTAAIKSVQDNTVTDVQELCKQLESTMADQKTWATRAKSKLTEDKRARAAEAKTQ